MGGSNTADSCWEKRQGIVDNVIFVGSTADFPMLIDSTQLVATELRSLQQIIRRNDGTEVPVK